MQIKKRLCAAILLCCFIISYIPIASAADAALFSCGWDDWQVREVQSGAVNEYSLTCPVQNVTAQQLQEYMLSIMAYCRRIQPEAARITVTFPYVNKAYDDMLAFFRKDITDAVQIQTGLRAVCCSFMNISVCKLSRQGENMSITLTLDVNNSNTTPLFAPGITYDAGTFTGLKTLADSIKAQTSDPRQQVQLLNRYLASSIRYGSPQIADRGHCSVGVMQDKMATCGGFANTLNDVCYLLGIPCYAMYDAANAHIWNVVQIDGKWLMIDCTWNTTGGKQDRFLLLEDFTDAGHVYTIEERAALEQYAGLYWEVDGKADTIKSVMDASKTAVMVGIMSVLFR